VPSGTVTLLFTDIEGSTVRWERDAVAMQDALARHDTIVRTQVERFGGYVFKTIGDAFCVAFGRAEDAVCAAIETQAALGRADFRAVGDLTVRMALHTGTNYERDGDYLGPSVNRVSRLLAAGHGGQILATGATAELVRLRLPKRVELCDLGMHRLKDLDRPENVFQVDSPDLRSDFPPLRAASAAANNLPLDLNVFIGRKREVAELGALLANGRLVTIVGSGGIGKTRTSVQVGTAQLDRFDHGVWFVELAPLSDGALVAATFAAACRLEPEPSGDPEAALVDALASKKTLLLVDNCEHLIGDVARVVAAILRGCPDVRVLATSRQTLGITGERAYRMPSLSVPDADRAVTARSASEFEAIRLFVQRAQALDARFELTDTTAPIVGEICRKLDGIALAIELAAARVRVLAPRQLCDRLDRRLKLLASVDRTLSARQRTLRALLDWSFELLDARERGVFSRLGIFADGFSLEAADAVCADEEIDAFDVMDVMSSLVDKSLVVAELDVEPVRYRLLESIREYALALMDERDQRPATAARHAGYYAELADVSEREYERAGSDGPLAALQPELGNVRASLSWASEADIATAVKLLAASRFFWRRWNASAEGIERCERLASQVSADPAASARLWNVAAYLAYKTGRVVIALDFAERAVATARAAGEKKAIFDALLCRAFPLMYVGRTDEAEADIVAAETMLGAGAPTVERIRLLEAAGVLRNWRNDYAGAAAAFAALQAMHHANDNVEGVVNAGINRAECEYALGRTQTAIDLLQTLMPSASTLGRNWRTLMLGNLCGYLTAQSNLAEARAVARDAIELARNDLDSPIVGNALEHLALILALEGEPRRAAFIFGYCDAMKSATGFRRQRTEQITHDRLRALLKSVFGAAELRTLYATGAAMSAPMAVAMALQGMPA
jgi:predicted ATPase/class 3 adenylate cyclase